MRFADSFSHNQGREFVDSLGLRMEILEAVKAPDLPVVEGGAAALRSHISSQLRQRGWAGPIQLSESLDVEVNAMKRGCALHVQTGNVTRAFYDLMKLQALYDDGRARGGVLIVPTRAAARTIGGTRPEFERIRDELAFAYARQFSMPLFLVAFE